MIATTVQDIAVDMDTTVIPPMTPMVPLAAGAADIADMGPVEQAEVRAVPDITVLAVRG